jgi:DNA-binding transcriptional ArsR family regulator
MTHEADELARILKVLAVGTRVRIVQILKGRALCVGALASRLDVTQGAVSQHLRVMRDAGLVIDEKRGYFVHYRLNQETLDRWRKQIEGLLAPVPAVKCRCHRRRDRNREN